MERIVILIGNTAFAVALGMALVGPGRLLQKALRLRFESAAWRNLHALAFGFGLVTFVTYLLGFAGFFNRQALVGVLALGTAASLLEVRAVWSEAKAGARAWRAWLCSPNVPRTSKWMAAALTAFLFAIFLRCFLPAVHTDVLHYQLTVPQQWLFEGRIALLPTHLTSELPAGVWMLYGITQATLGFGPGALACQLIDFGFFLASLGALYLGVREIASERAARWALAAYATTPAVRPCSSPPISSTLPLSTATTTRPARISSSRSAKPICPPQTGGSPTTTCSPTAEAP